MFRRLVHALARLVRLVLLAALLIAAWSLCEPGVLVVRRAEVTPGDWSAPEVRVALLSDLHVGSPWNDLDRLRDIVNRTNALAPDVVLLLGDYDINEIVGGEKVSPAAFAAELGRLRARDGVYAVLGNHDYWNDEVAIREALEANGIPVLRNEAERIGKGRRAWWLVGIDDSVTGHDRVAAAFRGVPADASVIAMTHSPDVHADRALRSDLLVAGHTHGGQVSLPLLGAPALRSGLVHGFYTARGRDVWVTSGVGTSIYPVRLGVPPEVVLLTVRAAAGERALVSGG